MSLLKVSWDVNQFSYKALGKPKLHNPTLRDFFNKRRFNNEFYGFSKKKKNSLIKTLKYKYTKTTKEFHILFSQNSDIEWGFYKIWKIYLSIYFYEILQLF